MPLHDWKRVDAGIYHAFHHRWISAISDALNSGLLPDDCYALPEQIVAGVGPDVLTLQAPAADSSAAGTATLPKPTTRFSAEAAAEYYRRKKSRIAVRHVSGDRTVAVIEIVSPGNKSSRAGFRAFIDKTCELLEYRIHLLLIDPFPPTRRDPNGFHAVVWAEVDDAPFQLPADKPLTFAAYACGYTTRAFIEPIAVGDPLPTMPLFLDPDLYVSVPLDETYRTAFAAMPRRWRDVLEPPSA